MKRGGEDFCHTSCLVLACQTTQKAVGVVTGRTLLHPQALHLPDGGFGGRGVKRNEADEKRAKENPAKDLSGKS